MSLSVHRGYWVRDDGTTSDRYVVNEVFHRGYRTFLEQIQPEDVVVDVGANIGSVTCACAAKGASVVSIEPFPENVAVLKKNVARFAVEKSVDVIPAAMTSSSHTGKTTSLYVSRWNAGHSTRPRRGRPSIQVPAISVSGLRLEKNPTAVKIDCEGGEYEFLSEMVLAWPTVRVMAIEFNLASKPEVKMAVDNYNLILESFDELISPNMSPSGRVAFGVFVRKAM